ncbi:BMP family ABC transporter substrate-binding protein [Actinomadura logoneensis]|uniref:BMP family ABC transporter substrate-binding protein n=1 Tax=Actinomadura logoneensis TaxID=2293572 RepID=A0A372JR63_9ACTN|nr:BMP family ABC transporter substrate-binding protein [Actinomadura logoneensis]RFU41848.1 BMP family ABC transporter substrate-binding protein [Actinomadura logoneensis]
MRRVLKITLVSVAGAALALNTAACGGKKSSSGDSGGGDGKKSIKVGLAFDIGGRGDQSFNDSAAAGLDKVKKDLNVTTEEISAKPDEPDADKESRLRLLAGKGYKAIIGVGFAYTNAVVKVAKDFPDTKFLVVDADQCTVSGSNVEGACFSEEQGSYLVGAAAALKSKTGTIGFIGGVNTPLIQKFEAGYVAGAKAAKPGIKVLPAKYLTQPPNFDGFKNPALGNEAAKGQLDAGADVIYHAAGGAGIGVIKTVGGAGKWAIGVDSDQYNQPAVSSVKDHILTSMVKRVDTSVFDFVKAVADGSFQAGVKKYDLSNDGVSYATTGGFVDDVKAKLDQYKADIVSGKIKVPTKPGA